MNKILLFILLLALSLPGISLAQHLKKDGTPDHRYKENKTSYNYKPSTSYKTATHHRSNYIYNVKRDRKVRIKRSESVKREFMKQTGYPKGRPGYVIDHIIPLKRGGCDCPANMQWQIKGAAKQKDKRE